MITRPVLEVDVIDVCNLSCKSCGHIAPQYRKNHYTYEQFKADVEALATVYHVDTLVFLGGEPLLLRERIPDYVKVVRESGICNNLRIVTNGILAPQYSEYLKLFDWVNISLYRHDRRQSIVDWFNGAEKEFHELGKHIYLNPVEKFATNYTTERLTDERAELSWKKCGARKTCHQLYCGSYYLCGPIAKFHRALDEKGIHVEQKGCPLHQDGLEERLKAYLETKEKLPTCFHCLGHLDWHAWEQEPRK